MIVASLLPTYVTCASDGGELGSVGKRIGWKICIIHTYPVGIWLKHGNSQSSSVFAVTAAEGPAPIRVEACTINV